MFGLKRLFLLIFNLSIFSARARGNFREISCENIQNRYWSYVGNQETCLITQTFITSDQTVISRHENVSALSFRENQRILFLPNDISESFPGLVALSANRCSLKTIKRECFKFLKHLTALFLFDNFIETISDGTFSNLESLELIDLRHNKIKTIGAQAFVNSKRLIHLWLGSNCCISFDFVTEKQMNLFLNSPTSHCQPYTESNSLFITDKCRKGCKSYKKTFRTRLMWMSGCKVIMKYKSIEALKAFKELRIQEENKPITEPPQKIKNLPKPIKYRTFP